MKRILLLIISLTLCVNGFGTTYYVSRDGDNTVGTSWATAWSDSLTALDSVEANMTGGDTVFFGAGIWIGRITPPNGGTSGDRTCYADSGISLNPIEYTGLSRITLGKVVTGWEVYSGNVYKSYMEYIEDGLFVNTYTATQDDSMLGFANALVNVDAPGEYWHDPSTDSVYVYSYDSADPDNHCIRIAYGAEVIDIPTGSDYVTIIGLEISHGNKSAVVMLGGQDVNNKPDYINVFHCEIHSLSDSGDHQNPCGIGIRSGGGSDSSLYAHGDTIRGCTIHGIRNGMTWIGHNKCLCYYSAVSCVVESCYTYGAGIGINYKCDQGGLQPNNVIRFNVIEGSGEGINLTTHHYRDSIYGNIIHDLIGNGWGITLEYNSESDECDNFICNNTIYNCAKPIVMCPTDGDMMGQPFSSSMKYNIVDYTSSEPLYINNYCYGDDSQFVWDSSVYYRDGGAISIDNYANWAAWQAAGFDVHTTVTDPGLNASYEPVNLSAWTTPIIYGGRTWFGPGAVQTLWESTNNNKSKERFKGWRQ